MVSSVSEQPPLTNRHLHLDADRPTVHVRCGEGLRAPLARCGLHGRYLDFADPFCVGPVPRLARAAFVRRRALFLARALRPLDSSMVRRQRQGYHDLCRIGAGQRVVLWFEADSHDQLILAYLLDYFGRCWPSVRLELVVTDSPPGTRRPLGFAQLTPDALVELWQRRQPVDESLLVLGRRAWRSITSETPEALHRLTRHTTAALPMLGRALRRHLLELPDQATGLSLSEQLIVQLVAERGPRPAAEVFRDLMHDRETLPYLSPALFSWMLEPLLGGATPVMRCESGPRQPWGTRELVITDQGHAVLSGYHNWLDSRPRRRWVGGVAVDGDRPGWCIDKASGRPTRRSSGQPHL